MTSHGPTHDSYGKGADFWRRLDKSIQSDFICRPQVLDIIGDPSEKRIADLGCGEGYVSRLLAGNKAIVTSVEINDALLARALQSEKEKPLNINYRRGDATNLHGIIADQSQDVTMSINVSPHLTPEELEAHILEAARVLRSGGTLIIAAPHPDRFIDRARTGWCTFDYDSLPEEKDKPVPITLYSGRGGSFSAAVYPHSREAYLAAILRAGLTVIQIAEPLATAEDTKSFSHLWGAETTLPFYFIVEARKP